MICVDVGGVRSALPGGRVEAGEAARSALVREMSEELEESVACDDLLYVVENFFAHAGKPYHEVGFYFTAHLNAGSKVLDISCVHWGVEGSRRLEYRWFELKQLANLDLRPSFLRQSLSREVLKFEHILQRG